LFEISAPPASDISVLKIVSVLVSIQFWANNFYFSSSYSFSFELSFFFIPVTGKLQFKFLLTLHMFPLIDRQGAYTTSVS